MAPFSNIAGGPVDRGNFARFQASIEPAWIDEALTVTGVASVRRRRFPAEQVLWLVVGMALFRDLPIAEVVKELGLVMPNASGKGVVPSAVVQARARLGDAPLRWLFDKCARHWALASAARHSWRGLSLFGIDGTTVRVPDSAENRAEFGGQSAGSRGNSGYPLVRLVTVMALRSHLLLAAVFGSYGVSERAYAKDLWDALPDNSLLIADRNFMYAQEFIPLHAGGVNRHWLSRARKNMRYRVIERLGRGDEIIEMTVTDEARHKNPTLPECWRVRAIRYRRPGFRPQRLLTSLTDAKKFPRDEIVALYHERWEIELGFDEVKTEMLEREETIRSRTPAGVKQELWGLGLAYNIVRLEMERAAEQANVPPTRMSFVYCLRAIRVELLRLVFASPANIPKRLVALREHLAEDCVLPPRRSGRIYPRAVKIKMSNYPRKRTKATRRRRRAN